MDVENLTAKQRAEMLQRIPAAMCRLVTALPQALDRAILKSLTAERQGESRTNAEPAADESSKPAAPSRSRGKRKPPRRKPGQLNGEMLAVLMAEEEMRGATASRWAKRLKATPSQIVDQPTWKNLEKYRELQKIARQKSVRRGRLVK